MPLNKILDGKIQKLWDGFPSQLQGEAEQPPLKMAFVISGSHMCIMCQVPGSPVMWTHKPHSSTPDAREETQPNVQEGPGMHGATVWHLTLINIQHLKRNDPKSGSPNSELPV